jgi:hypothetical protein
MLPNLTTFIWLFNTCAVLCMHLKSADRFICFKELQVLCLCEQLSNKYVLRDVATLRMLTCNVVIWTVWLWDLSNVEKGTQHYALYWEKLYDQVEPNCVILTGHFMQCIVGMEQRLQRFCWSWTTCIELVVPYMSLWAVGIFFEFTVFKKNSKISRSFCGQRENLAWKKYCSRLQQKPPVFHSW